MASQLGACSRASFLPLRRHKHRLLPPPEQALPVGARNARTRELRFRVRVSDGGGGSYLDMWKKAIDSERKSMEFQKIVENLEAPISGGGDDASPEELEKKNEEFQKLLEVSKEERDRIQRIQVVDRAAAAIAAARSILKDSGSAGEPGSGEGSLGVGKFRGESDGGKAASKRGKRTWSRVVRRPESSGNVIPGPDFWSWTPPAGSDGRLDNSTDLQPAPKSSATPSSGNPVVEKKWSVDFLSIPLESKSSESDHSPPLPPLQSFMEVQKVEASESTLETPSPQEHHELDVEFSAHAAEAARALENVDELSYEVQTDGSRKWKETGIEVRPDGVICRWTMIRGVSADQVTEWQEKFWESSDELGHKELGSEKSGRDATGNVWREYWKESMWQERGLLHMEKTADKWGKNGNGDQWQEQWFERYGASGQAEKWAHKWCTIDPNTPLDAGHAHIWHERWGETYDGQGGSVKYTDKWAERSEGDGWTKWGDKWDEHFDPNGHGVKQGETWWAGKYGERWNRTWGEQHNGSGWVHKYGKSSSGEHWDTHEHQETWYERFPHFGFYHCFENSVQLREVPKPSEIIDK
ncbi:hypothetical protein UlMin_009784 [Ulmus minor]